MNGGDRKRSKATSRRENLKAMAIGAAGARLGFPPGLIASERQQEKVSPPEHERRMKWWRDAKYGMFVHWGLYSVLGREAWAMGRRYPLAEYEKLTAQFRPQPDAARAWARLARESGMRYMVMTPAP